MSSWGNYEDLRVGGKVIRKGTGSCYCVGHSYEVFIKALDLWYRENATSEADLPGTFSIAHEAMGTSALHRHFFGAGVAPHPGVAFE
jgi:hypothetical protein